jgi:hypothetical protein
MKLTTTTFVSVDGVMQGISRRDEDRQPCIWLLRVFTFLGSSVKKAQVPSASSGTHLANSTISRFISLVSSSMVCLQMGMGQPKL